MTDIEVIHILRQEIIKMGEIILSQGKKITRYESIIKKLKKKV